MCSHGWQVGLHFTSKNVSVIAVQPQRKGWILQQWGLFPLLKPVFTPAGLCGDTRQIAELLQKIRAELPRRHSLRVSYPFRLVLLRTLPLPMKTRNTLDSERYIAAAMGKLFTHLHELCWDYRVDPPPGTEVCVTIARTQVVEAYALLFQQAGLRLEVMEPPSASLYALLPDKRDDCILMPEEEHWLWAAKNDRQQRHGWLARQDFPQVDSVFAALPLQCTSYVGVSDAQAYDSQIIHPFSPFSLVTASRAPPPSSHHLFTVALGLALRSADRL